MRTYYVFVFLSALLLGCTPDRSKNSKNIAEKEIKEEVLDPYVRSRKSLKHQTVYRVPTPIEFYKFFQDAGGKFQRNLMTSNENVKQYISSKEKAVAFGIYASDLAYSAVYGYNQQTISYFETNKILAEDLGFLRGFGEDLLKRFNNNLNNVDSLYQISTDSYWSVFTYLEDQDKTSMLSYVIISGWLESLYIAYNSVPSFEENEVVNCLADQLYVIENLHAYIQSVHKNQMKTNNVFRIVKDLYDVYTELYNNPEEVIMTKEQFDKIQSTVNQGRKTIFDN